MHPVVFYESFFSCPRDDLERLQPLSRSLLNMIVAGSHVLPLRPIHRVDMDDEIKIFVEDHVRPDYEASVLDGDFAETFRRLQHTCIKTVLVGISESPFLSYWKAQKTASFTVIILRSLGFDFGWRTDYEATPDYDVLDSIVDHLRPRTNQHVIIDDSSWRENGHNSKYLKALARDSFLNSLQTCRLRAQGNAFPPSGFFLNKPGYRNYEVDAQSLQSKAADGIDSFIESFVRDGCANTKLESVHITWYESSEDTPSVLKQLSKSTKTDSSLPEIGWDASFTHYVHKAQCEMYSFVNTKQRKRLEVYKWRSKDLYFFCLRHETHVLHCRVKNL
ncbi:hypothetical protein AAVH_34069 [Aphelenchoides avenae]|nr:hypothetical protein AAVH_34069 [Aphelenchus avenae]